MRKFALLIALVVLGLAGWHQRDRLKQLVGLGETEAETVKLVASPQLARVADAKLERLRNGEVERIAFHSAELQSLLQYRFIQMLPAFVDSPEVKLEKGTISVTGRVPVENLPNINELGDAAAFLPDTAEVALRGKLLPLDSGRIALSIEEVKAARIPLPDRLVPRALKKLGREDERGLPENALALQLPRGVRSMQVVADSLILFAYPVSRANH